MCVRTVLTQLHVLRGVSAVQHGLLAGLQGALDGGALDVVVEVAGQQVGHHDCGQQVDGVTRQPVDLLAGVTEPLGGLLLLWVVLLLDHHAEPAGRRQ